MPTGRPDLVSPTGKLTPGMPPTLPGPVLRMNVGNVGAATPLSMKVSSSPILTAGARVVGKMMAATGPLQPRPLLQLLPIGILRNGAGAGQTLQDALDVRTRAFGDKARIIKACTVLFQILVEV